MANKMTQRDYFNEIIALATANGRSDLVEFCKGRIEKLDAKVGSKKPTKTQTENEGYKTLIVDALNGADPMTVTEILKTVDFGAELSNQKVTALMRQLVEVGVVEKVVDKKVSRFKVVGE